MPKKVEFEIDDDLTPIEGVAVLVCFAEGSEDTPIIVPGFNDPKKHSVIGMLTGALDMARTSFAADWQGDEEDDG